MKEKIRLLKPEHAGIEDAFGDYVYVLEGCKDLAVMSHDYGAIDFAKDLNNEGKIKVDLDVLCISYLNKNEYTLTYAEYLYYLLETKRIAEKMNLCKKGEFDSNIEEFKRVTGVTKPARRSFWSIFKR